MSDKKWEEREVGALWKKVSNGGKNFYSGTLTVDGKKMRIVGFANTDKKEGQPDVRLYVDEEKKDK